MNRKNLLCLSAVVVLSAALIGFRYAARDRFPAPPKDLRDAPNSGAFGSLSLDDAPDVPVPSAQPNKAVGADARGTGKWTGWLKAREDYGYLPGTQNIDSGSSGFKVYYRCSAFAEEAGGVSMEMQFGNDKGGDLGIVSWTRGPSDNDIVRVRFEGTASLSSGKLPYGETARVLNGIRDYEGLCADAYKSIEVHRPAIVKYLMKKDIKSMQRLYAAAKFIPGPLGMFSEGMEITLDLSQRENGMAAAGAGCLVAGIVVEKVTHGVIRSKVLNYMLEKTCSGGMTAAGALTHHEGAEGSGKEPLYFAGVLKQTSRSVHHSLKQSGGKWVAVQDPVSVSMNLAYVEKEETIKNVFFDRWR